MESQHYARGRLGGMRARVAGAGSTTAADVACASAKATLTANEPNVPGSLMEAQEAFDGAVLGTHVHISGKHMWKYVAEFTYRRNFRNSHMAMFDRLVAACGLPRLQDA